MQGYLKDGFTWFVYFDEKAKEWNAVCPMHDRSLTDKFKVGLLKKLDINEAHNDDFMKIESLANRRMNRPV